MRGFPVPRLPAVAPDGVAVIAGDRDCRHLYPVRPRPLAGLFLRGGPGVDGWSTDPIQVAAFTVATLSPLSISIGLFWARSRSLLLIVLVHGAIDALPNTAEFVASGAILRLRSSRGHMVRLGPAPAGAAERGMP